MMEQQLKAINRLKRPEHATEQDVEANRPRELIRQNLHLAGSIKGVDRIYLQSAVDGSNSVGFGRNYASKPPIHSVALIHEVGEL